ncbi:MAG: hypothetical protein AAFY67_14370 [Cyanobacteria bacterium J06642_9]
MARCKFHQVAIAVALGNSLSLGFWVAPSVAGSEDGSNLSQGLPGRRIGGGTRSLDVAIGQEQSPLTALLPESNLAMVTAEHLALLFYIP